MGCRDSYEHNRAHNLVSIIENWPKTGFCVRDCLPYPSPQLRKDTDFMLVYTPGKFITDIREVLERVKQLGKPAFFMLSSWKTSMARMWRNKPSGIVLSLITVTFMLVTFIQSVSCNGGLFGCSLRSFGVIFPLHLIFSGLQKDINLPTYVAYFAGSSVIYSYIAFKAGECIQNAAKQARNYAGVGNSELINPT
jgi:hypothetical protein